MSLSDIWRKNCSVGLASGLNNECYIDCAHAHYLRSKFKMALYCKVNAISPIDVSDTLLPRSIWQVWPFFAILDLLHWLSGLDFVLHRFGSSAYLHSICNARHAYHTISYFLCSRAIDEWSHREDGSRHNAVLANIFLGDNNHVHLTATQEDEYVKWIKCEAPRRHAWRPHHSI